MSIDQCKADKNTTIICSRDKDLKMVPGMHYSWECGRQPSFGPIEVDEIGEIKLVKEGKKIEGTGIKFFYSQAITGDSVDNIPGLPRGGPNMAFKALEKLYTEEELFKATYALYKEKFAENAIEKLREQLYLLWMIRELDDNGKPVMYDIERFL